MALAGTCVWTNKLEYSRELHAPETFWLSGLFISERDWAARAVPIGILEDLREVCQTRILPAWLGLVDCLVFLLQSGKVLDRPVNTSQIYRSNPRLPKADGIWHSFGTVLNDCRGLPPDKTYGRLSTFPAYPRLGNI